MTELLYQTDAYTREFTAAVTGTDPQQSAFTLDRTAFFPGGGGQPADRGSIEYGGKEIELIRVAKEGDEILHFTEGELPEIGAKVTGRVDWPRRYKLMRTHSAMHVLCGVVWRDYQAQVTGGNMEPLKGRMDFEFKDFSADLVQEIEEKVNTEIGAGRPISVRILPREEAEMIPDLIRTKINLLPNSLTKIRVVEISGLDLQADGGTHVANTSEIGSFRIVGHKSKGKINKRLKIELEERD